MKLIKGVLHFFDKFEDRVRGRLSHYPILYAIIGGAGIVLFWRGVWVTADYVFETLAVWQFTDHVSTMTPASGIVWWDGPLSFLIGLCILLATGVFVSNFIGNEIIIAGLRGDKKISEKTEHEMRMEVGAIGEIRSEVRKISELVDKLDKPGK